MKYLRVKNWEKYQHYNEDKPPWIKIYTELLDADNLLYSQLADASKLLLIHLWLLASRHGNRIPYDLVWLQSRLNIRTRISLAPILDSGFIQLIEELENGLGNLLSVSVSDDSFSVSHRKESIPVFDSEMVFESVWPQYPKRIGRKAALRHFKASVRTPEDLANFSVALGKYKRFAGELDPKFIKHGSTWFHEWPDWIDYAETVGPALVIDPRDALLDKRDAFIAANGKPSDEAAFDSFRAAVGYNLETVQQYASSAERGETIEEWLKRKGAA